MSSEFIVHPSSLKPLPSGFPDKRAPDAEKHLTVSHELVRFFIRHGYEFYAPPLAEHLETLASRADVRDLFRVTDPLSRETLGLRSDITAQIARIIETDLLHAAPSFPLRVSYMGPCLRAAPDAPGGLRERTQAGVECVGAPLADSLREVTELLLRNLRRFSVQGLAVTIGLPELTRNIEHLYGLEGEQAQKLRACMALKDLGGVRALLGPRADSVVDLRWLLGLRTEAENRVSLSPDPFPAELAPYVQTALGLTQTLKALFPEVAFRIDPADVRRFPYHRDIVFSVSCSETRAELARGGHYQVRGYDAVGATLYAEEVCAAAPWPADAERNVRVLAVHDVAYERVRALIEEGYRVLYCSAHTGDLHEEARRCGCAQVCDNEGRLRPVEEP